MLKVMIANAGIILVKPLLEISANEWDRIQAVSPPVTISSRVIILIGNKINVRGVFLCYKHAGLEMIKQGRGGKIIGACSISGYRPVSRSYLENI